jgi:hypothetical protein
VSYATPRKSRRVPLPVRVHLKLEGVPDPVTETLLNVSLGGMAMAIRRPPELGSLLTFEFDLGESLIEGTGEVVWIHPIPEHFAGKSEVGIRFRYLSTGSRERIFRLVQWYTGQEQTPTPEEVADAVASGRMAPAPGSSPLPKAGSAPEPATATRMMPATKAGEEGPPVSFPVPPRRQEAPPAADWRFPSAPASEPPPPTAPAEPASSFQPFEERYRPPGEEAVGATVRFPTPTADRLDEDLEPALERPAAPFAATREPLPRRGSTLGTVAKLFALGLVLGLLALAAYLYSDVWLGALGLASKPAAETPKAAQVAEVPKPLAPSLPPSGKPGVTLAEEVAATAPAGEPVETAPEATPEAEPEPTPEAVPPPTPQVEAPAPAPSEAASARTIESIGASRGAGATTIEIRAGGALRADDVVVSRLPGAPPKVLVKLLGINRLYQPNTIEVGTEELQRIRVGLHVGARDSALHVVLDLGGADIEVASREVRGDTLRLRLTRG